MHPRIHEQMANQRMEELQREAAAMQRMNRANSDADSRSSIHSFTPILWYLLIGLRIPTSSQKQSAISEEYNLGKLQAGLNATTRVVGLAALGLGLLMGGFLNSSFGLLPIVLLGGIVLVAVSFPILMRSVWMLTKHANHPFDLDRALARKSRNRLLPALSSKTSPSTNCGVPMGSLGSHDGSSCDA